MTLDCYIVDDEQSGINVLTDYVERTASLKLLGSSTNPIHALDEFRKNGFPKVLFLDIDMPGISGLELSLFAKDSVIIFCTSFREYAADAYETAAFDYLLKPIRFERFEKCMARLEAFMADRSAHTLMLHSGTKRTLVQVKTDEIIFIKGLLNYVEIYFNEQKLVTYTSMEEILHRLPEKYFSRVHKSYIINHRHLARITDNKILMTGDVQIPVGRAFRKKFLEKL